MLLTYLTLMLTKIFCLSTLSTNNHMLNEVDMFCISTKLSINSTIYFYYKYLKAILLCFGDFLSILSYKP